MGEEVAGPFYAEKHRPPKPGTANEGCNPSEPGVYAVWDPPWWRRMRWTGSAWRHVRGWPGWRKRVAGWRPLRVAVEAGETHNT